VAGQLSLGLLAGTSQAAAAAPGGQIGDLPPGAVLPAPPTDLARPRDRIAAPGSPFVIRQAPEAGPPPGSQTLITLIADVTVEGSTLYPADVLIPY
jgi:hypothetical protein